MRLTTQIFLYLAFLLYDTDMLEDLDHLSQRLASLVAYAQQLANDRNALQMRLKRAESERDALQAQLDKEGVQARALHSKVNAFESEIEGIRAQSSVKNAALQGSLDLFKQEQSTLQAELHSRAQEVAQLRAVTVQAKERIDAVLMRLPGAQPEEQR